MLERETAREKNLEKAQKEAKARARKTTIAVVAPDDPHELPTAAAEPNMETEAQADSSDDIAKVPDISLPTSKHSQHVLEDAMKCHHVLKYSMLALSGSIVVGLCSWKRSSLRVLCEEHSM